MAIFDQRAERSTSRYQKAREAFLSNPDHALCVSCKSKGFTVAAKELDHKVPVKDAPERFWDQENWQGLCKGCHEAKTAREARNESDEVAKWREYVEGTSA